jgi:hypothetical protein
LPPTLAAVGVQLPPTRMRAIWFAVDGGSDATFVLARGSVRSGVSPIAEHMYHL